LLEEQPIGANQKKDRTRIKIYIRIYIRILRRLIDVLDIFTV